MNGTPGIHKHVWKYNIKMDLKEIVCNNGDYTDLTHYRDQGTDFVNMIMNIGVRKILSFLG
jgi:hypothetical protein